MAITPWKQQVRLYDADTTYDVDPQNVPIKDLIQRTDSLYERLNSLSDKNSLIIESVDVKADASPGSVMFWNEAALHFAPARARWSDTYGPNGELVIDPEGIAQGIMLDAPVSGIADIIIGGSTVLTDAQMLNLFGIAEPAMGQYWLSAVDEGKVTNIKPATPVPVLYYRGAHIINVNIGAPPEHNHIHKNYLLEESWYDTSDPIFDDLEKPAGAQWGYDRFSDAYVDELFMTYPGDFTVTINGVVSNEFVVNKDNVWFINAGDPSLLGDLNMFTAVPYNYGQPIVRAIRTDQTDELSITGLNGVVTVNNKPWEESTPVLSAFAVSSIEGRTQNITPVVSALYPQKYSGIRIYKNASTGEHVIDSDAGGLGDRYADVINLNNAMQVTDGAYILLNFPEGRDSSMIGAIPCPQINQVAASGSIMAFADAGGGLVTVTSVAHGRSNGDEVVIQGTSNYNGTYTISNVTDNTFDIVTAWVADDAAGTWYFALGFHYEITVFAERAGIIGGTVGTPISFPAITVDVTYTQQAAPGTPVDTAASLTLATTIPAEDTVQGMKYFTLAAAALSVNDPGTLYIKLSMPNDTINRSIYSFGARIELVAN